MNYANKELGTLLGVLSGSVEGSMQGVGEAGAATGAALAKLPGAFGAADVASALSASSGAALNPFKETVFESVDFRSFAFKYKFFPKNKKESDDVFNIIKYLDEYENKTLYEDILNFEINLSSRNINKKILQVLKDEVNNIESNIFNFNYLQATLGDNNNKQKKVIEDFDYFLQNKIMLSNLMTEIKLKRGEALIFNDEKMIHGRRSIIGERYYLKCGILVPEIIMININKL